MEYRLYAAEDRQTPVANIRCDDDYRAETWARTWAMEEACGVDYRLEREDGAWGATIFQTVGGQWYVMRR
jgi:hypothetical protein